MYKTTLVIFTTSFFLRSTALPLDTDNHDDILPSMSPEVPQDSYLHFRPTKNENTEIPNQNISPKQEVTVLTHAQNAKSKSTILRKILDHNSDKAFQQAVLALHAFDHTSTGKLLSSCHFHVNFVKHFTVDLKDQENHVEFYLSALDRAQKECGEKLKCFGTISVSSEVEEVGCEDIEGMLNQVQGENLETEEVDSEESEDQGQLEALDLDFENKVEENTEEVAGSGEEAAARVRYFGGNPDSLLYNKDNTVENSEEIVAEIMNRL